MFRLFSRANRPSKVDEYNASVVAMVKASNDKADAEQAEYNNAVTLDVKPSVEGNKVVFYDKEAVERGTRRDGMFVLSYGSVALKGNKKIFKNEFGEVERIEIFESMACRLEIV